MEQGFACWLALLCLWLLSRRVAEAKQSTAKQSLRPDSQGSHALCGSRAESDQAFVLEQGKSTAQPSIDGLPMPSTASIASTAWQRALVRRVAPSSPFEVGALCWDPADRYWESRGQVQRESPEDGVASCVAAWFRTKDTGWRLAQRHRRNVARTHHNPGDTSSGWAGSLQAMAVDRKAGSRSH
ncbi:hypothetical protein N5P37_008340 [Trichoderma harzianum]|uniref:Uncharacterized protein n=1 Tax=Trichoderma harzianum CBS 226.95 TaxID=983964 RepID=A0A2T4AMI7_TRIHA|nr:hypothetical protein M431DRAFT_479783 [Trichoderma harzianum CBS 226.95]KAK0758856.1 hypothetical protein N5P37_008340 [Trichoderma harzianum]PTB58286.1 hypothetical protein M431DRAFT_479783 [Trichoderma harzianum CBS 226.95]